jgi:hypothetical protein
MTRDFYMRKIFPLGFLMASTLGFGTSAGPLRTLSRKIGQLIPEPAPAADR